ncbi:HAMP domain-containing histidine kinase [Polynucleobacter sp. JS-Mosq-20-D10]|uniref:sensor histidine kinase n=1 Tax=Polynucleobacter sp. JS-Mosq-20-D10 TaxID=2576922 RepID=UPI001BFD8F18|nr:HAMP domain-containing sensor histidine kinase [Polynucleobacter sp. JS-Mosq-20-D10]QWE00890.1 HAMP domain-containing histidine kinase [Polynucleobacter sp. JS-Mosq-20-D10]
MTPDTSKLPPEQDTLDATKHLEEAFAIFYAESQKLEAQQTALQDKINELSSELQKSNQRLAILLNAIPAGVILLENEVVLLHNPAVLIFLPKLKPGATFEIPSDWLASITPGEYVIAEKGVHQRLQKTVQVIRINEGSRSFIQIQDITANILRHEETQRENRLAAMGRMAAGIAHQFRTPLATALLYASHLCDGEINADTAKEFADRLRKQLLDLEKLSQDMLRFISNKPNKTVLVNATQIIEEAQASIQFLFKAKEVSLSVSTTNINQGNLLVEPKAISNAIVAILENALAVSKANETVSLIATSDQQMLTITISDQGPGIPREMLNSLFEPFATTSANGTGLGLSIAKNTIETHRGSISAESSKHGAVFKINLPYDQSSLIH